MKHTRTIGAVLIATLAACNKESGPPVDVNVVYRVFFEALAKEMGPDGNLVTHHWNDADLGTLVIHATTTTTAGLFWRVPEPERWEYVHRNFPSLRLDTFNDFCMRNEIEHRLTLTAAAPWKMRLLTDAEYGEIGGARGKDVDRFWREFHAKFPGSQLVSLSAPGASSDRTQALIYFTSAFGELAASGTCYLLEKRDGVWALADSWMVWVS